jgi:Bacteriophage protein of unknown function (DUF646).
MDVKDFQDEMRRRSAMVHSNLGRSVTNACYLVETTAKRGMTDTETDPEKAYSRQGGRKTHYASQEGAYPAVDTGALRQSITHDVEQDGSTVVGRVGTNLVYGSYLETGTSKMSPRPWLKPSVEVNREKIHSMIVSAIQGREVEISTDGGES